MVKIKTENLEKTLRYYKRAFLATYGSQKPDPEYIHDLRVYCRRLLAIIFLLRGDSRVKEHFEKILKQTGPVRDRYIYEKIISKHLGAEIKSTWPELWNPKSSENLETFKTHKEAIELIKELMESSNQSITKRMRKLHQSVVEKLRHLSPGSSNKAFHKIRIRVKKLRYVHDMVANSDSAKGKKINGCCRLAQAELGKLHDFQNIIKKYEASEDAKNSVIEMLKHKRDKHKAESIGHLKKLLRFLKD